MYNVIQLCVLAAICFIDVPVVYMCPDAVDSWCSRCVRLVLTVRSLAISYTSLQYSSQIPAFLVQE